MEISEVTPPKNSLVNEVAFIIAYIPPTHSIFEIVSFDVKSREVVSNRMIETNIWTNINEKSILNQDLKIQESEWIDKHRKAKGESKIKSSTSMYLRLKDNPKEKKPKEIKLFRIPSNEKIFT